MTGEGAHTEAYRTLCYGDSVFKERYEGWEELGHGGHAVVARVTSRVLDKEIAVKIFTPLAESDRPRFQREANNAAEVSSPFIVRPMGVFVRGSLGWIEMELVDGPDLGRELERRQAAGDPYTLPEALAIAIDVTRGLVHAHQASLIHRDIKPANIYLPRSRRPAAKLGDFGIARLAESMKLTKTDVFRGTPEWTSPEGADGKALDVPHDIYCLGLTLFSLFTNNAKAIPLPPQATPQMVLRAHLKQQPRLARSLNPELPRPLEDLLARCLLKRPPSERPTAGRLLEELQDVRRRALRQTPSGSVAARAAATPTSRIAFALGVAAVIGLVAMATATALRRSAGTPPPIPVPSLAETLGSTAPALKARAAAAASAPVGPRAVLHDRFLRLSTAKETLRGARLTLVGAAGSYEYRAADPLEAETTVFLSLDDFAPVPAAAEQFQELRIAALGASGPLEVALPIR